MENQINDMGKKMLLPIGELFKKSFDIYQKKVWTLALIVLFGCLGLLILTLLMIIVMALSYEPLNSGNISPTLILIDALLIFIGLLFCVILGLWSRVATYVAIKEDITDIKSILKLAWSKIGSFFWISLLVGLAVIAGLILFIIPGIIFSIWFSFAIYVFITEGLKGTEALKRSRQLVSGNWWPVFGRLLVIMMVVILVSWIKFFGPIINAFFVAPFSLVYIFSIYEDLKRIKG